MARFGFCGPTYQSESVNVSNQRTVNWYPEIEESGNGRSPIAMYPRPGLKVFVNLAGETSVSQMFTQNGRMFAAGLFLWEIFSNGTSNKIGNLNPAQSGFISMVANQNQILICSNGLLYLFNLTTNVLVAVNPAQFNGPIIQVEFSDGFFIALQQNSQVFYVSNLLDGSTWQAVNAEQVSLFTDNIVSMKVTHRELWLFGSKSSVVYFNSGAQLSPFLPIQGAFIEMGANSLAGTVKLDNAPYWVGQNENGALVAFRGAGYSPQRVSTHAVENAWRLYTTTSDVIAYTCQYNGHFFWVLYFPTANATWVYDATTQMWSEWDFLDPHLGPIAHRSQCHCFAFNQHFVGDWNSGNIYLMDISLLTDFGTPIRFLRRAPTVSKELEFLLHSRLVLDVETGLGPIPPLQGNLGATSFVLQAPNATLWSCQVQDGGLLQTTLITLGTPQTILINDPSNATTWQLGVTNGGLLTTTSVPLQSTNQQSILMVSLSGTLLWTLTVTLGGLLQTTAGGSVIRDPQVYLRWSDDSGHTWSNEYARDAGQAGKFKKRVVWRRLGRSRQRVYEVFASDPVPWRIVDAYLDAFPDFTPTERTLHQYRKGA